MAPSIASKKKSPSPQTSTKTLSTNDAVSESSSSDSDSDSSDETEQEGKPKAKAAEGKAEESDSSDTSDSDTSSDSDSDSSSDSDSDSESDSDSDSSSEESIKAPAKTPKTPAREGVSVTKKRKTDKQGTSVATAVISNTTAPSGSTTLKPSGNGKGNSDGNVNGKKARKSNTPFQRIKVDQITFSDERLRDNRFDARVSAFVLVVFDTRLIGLLGLPGCWGKGLWSACFSRPDRHSWRWIPEGEEQEEARELQGRGDHSAFTSHFVSIVAVRAEVFTDAKLQHQVHGLDRWLLEHCFLSPQTMIPPYLL